MRRRRVIHWIASAVAGSLPGCGFPTVRVGMGSAAYDLPERALDRLRRLAPGRHGCWRDGELIAGSGDSRPFPVLSVTKSVAALTTARAVTNGWLDPDEVVDFPVWKGKRRGILTLRHLLNSTAGLPPGDHELYSMHPPDKGRAALRLPFTHPPGVVFRYGPATWEVLGEFLRRRLPEHGTSLNRLLGEVIGELGVHSREWRQDGSGAPYLSTGIVCGLGGLGLLGAALCDLASGQDRAGVSASVFHDLTAPRAANPMFSAGIWWNRLARMPGARVVEPERSLGHELSPDFWRNSCLQPAARSDWFALVGSGGTRVYGLPTAGVVVAIARGGALWSDAAMLGALSEG